MIISKIGVIGSGQMGRGIAQVAAFSGLEVYLYDVLPESLNNAVEFIQSQLDRGVQKNKWTENEAKLAINNLKPVKSLEEMSGCDLIIEAATENKKIKLEIFSQLSKVVNPACILASNTSSISITEIAAATDRPEKVIGMHFMNPVPIMKLVEGIRGLETSDDTYERVKHTAEKMGKVFITVNDMPGFAVNRILMPMINEAIFTLQEGVATIEDIDTAMKLGTNVPMGPLELADFIGLDTCLAIMNVLFDGIGDTKYRPSPLLKQYVASGRLGRKSKRGFYEY
ncbi:MAG: 3-hydroxybutyryl-CoA dehydrogenase [Bdellovibrionales bacterium]|nr:3-hydroxybutyryl-CoA dehydrogenase [Bdellovibrionales bacterium]